MSKQLLKARVSHRVENVEWSSRGCLVCRDCGSIVVISDRTGWFTHYKGST